MRLKLDAIALISAVLIFLFLILVRGLLVAVFWNAVIPDVFHLPSISAWDGLMLSFLVGMFMPAKFTKHGD